MNAVSRRLRGPVSPGAGARAGGESQLPAANATLPGSEVTHSQGDARVATRPA